MNFTDAISTCFNKSIIFSERASRSEFWYFHLFLFLIHLFVLSFFRIDGENLSNFLTLITFIPSLSVSVRRLHDIHKTGWWILIAFTIIGIVLLIYWWVQEGKKEDNMFGKKYILEKHKDKNKTQQSSNNVSEDSLDKIKKLSKLKDDGIITEEDFQKKKKELLKNL